MRRKKLLVMGLAVFFVVGLSIFLFAGRGGCRRSETQEEYAVYAALLDHEALGGGAPGVLVIRDKTTVGEEVDGNDQLVLYVRQKHPQMDESVAKDFVAKNKTPHLLARKFPVKQEYVLLSEQEADEIFKHGWWDDFYRKYPNSGGITEFSRVGFNSRGNQALVGAGNSSGGLAGIGLIILLDKEGGTWRVKWQEVIWVS